ncbi:phosphatase PAP2 family protein [Ignavibacterium sp.]|uniref:phosphatase PAP2 family protein n=1 Tax=Ignavibacterium sp. TaxID=2651167 RepID=UPI00220C91B4|nr:phosphatase PAP2 family protein [Ignavibacterium sp.]BDQ04290.1 MAG: hypothetical protein KatS3mg037_2865 [Ignavibacterium sp.]
MKFFLSALIIFNISVYSQIIDSTVNSSQDFPTLNDDIKSFFNTGKNIFQAPSKFDNKDWITFGSLIALTASATLLDEDNREFWLNNKSQTLDYISEFGRIYGEISYAGIFAGTLYFGGRITKNKDLTVTGRMLIEGLFYAGVTTTLIKFVSGRSRPYKNDGHLDFRFFQTTNDYTSFPSGHSTVAFTTSTILSDRIDNTYATIALYSFALSTVWQRMYSDNHWLSDTIMGALIGYFIGKAVIKFDDSSETTDKAKSNPDLIDSNYYEIFSLKYSF